MYKFEIVSKSKINIKEYYNFEKKSIFTTLPWLNYLEKETGNSTTIIRITKCNEHIGYFTGTVIRKFGIKIFGSPFKGWGTCYMGFDLYDYSLAKDILSPLSIYIIKELKCVFIEIVDRNLNINELKELKYKVVPSKTLELDINKPDEELIYSFKKDCRNSIRQFEKKGATIKEVQPDSRFIKEYCNHLRDVFAKQKLVPTYDEKKVENLLNSLSNTRNLLCLEVYSPEGISIACSIIVAYNKHCYTFGTASERKYQLYRPNEFSRWYAMRYWRDKGAETMDMAGVRQYKYKFRPTEVEYPCIMISKYKILLYLRDVAQWLYYFLLKIKGYIYRIKN